MLSNEELVSLANQINFFNKKFHDSDGESSDFHELMRASKNRCQLMLLKFSSPNYVWIRKDEYSPNNEFLIGLKSQPENYAAHIPLSVLTENLTDAQLIQWKIL